MRRIVDRIAKHHKCNGTGLGSRPTAKCRECGGTGEAGPVFIKGLRKYGYEDDALFEQDADLDFVLDIYITARYGRRQAAQFDDEDRFRAHLFTVLQHSIDREACRTVIRLGGHERLFTMLVEQERFHMKDVKAGDFEW
jgi:hypothetical protein